MILFTDGEMNQKIAHVALVVDDYDEAIDFYVNKLQFQLLEDSVITDTKRWIIVSPQGASECSIVLVKAVGEEQRSRIGNQTGGRVFLFLHTDDFPRDYNNLLEQGIVIVRPPVVEKYGTVAVFQDLYGNLWDLIGPSQEGQK